MVERGGFVAVPDVVHAFDGVAAVRGDKPVEKIIPALERQVEAAAGKRAGHRFEQRVRLVDGFALRALDAIGHQVEGRENFIRHKAAEVADDFFPCVVQRARAGASLVIQLLDGFGNRHKRPPLSSLDGPDYSVNCG